MRPPRRPSPGDELRATLLVENVTARPGKPGPFGGIGEPELAFGLGFVLVFGGLALVSLPLALIAAGALLAGIAWRAA